MKRGQQQQYIQGFFMSKTGRYSAVQVRANPPGRAKLASKLASQSQPQRASEDYTSHLSAATGESQNMNFLQKVH